MRNLSLIFGVLLILFGVFCFASGGLDYTKTEEVAEIGNVQVTAETDKRVQFSPLLGAVSLVAGIVLVFVGRRR